MGTRSFKRSQDGDPPPPQSFWQRLFGRKTVPDERLSRAPIKRAQGPMGVPLDMPRNPKSFVAKKFDSNVVRKALLEAIARAEADPPGDLDAVGRWFWSQGLALKRAVVESLDCTSLKPDAHMRTITWMAAVERLDPRKATYREDLYAWRCKIRWIHDKDLPVPPAVAQGGQALRKLYQLVRQKTEGLGTLSPQAKEAAATEIDAYNRLMEAIEATADTQLDDRTGSQLSNVFARIDPFRYELTARHARFAETVSQLLTEIADLASRVPQPNET